MNVDRTDNIAPPILTVESYRTAVRDRSVEKALLIRFGSKVNGASFWMMEVLVA